MRNVCFKKGLAIGIIVLFLLVGIYPSLAIDTVKESIIPVNNGNTLYVGGSGPGNYTKIQDAIDNASDGDTVFVYNGIYAENIKINKSIYLVGESKENTIIDGCNNVDVITINMNGVTISGFNIRNSGTNGDWYDPDSGIDIESSFNKIYENIIDSNGIGISIRNSNNNISNNIILNNGHGMFVYNCERNIIGNNKIHDIQGKMFGMNAMAIYISEARNCDIIGNNIENNTWGIRIWHSSMINITKNHIVSNHHSLLLSNSDAIFISHNQIGEGLIPLDPNKLDKIELSYCHANIYKNNIFLPRVSLKGGIVILELSFFMIYKSENNWRNNYWGRPKLLFKIVAPIMIMRPYYCFYLDADWRPAKEPYEI